MKKVWFKAKEYGWGWYPSSWQGWIILLIYLLLLGESVGLIEKTQGIEQNLKNLEI